MAKGFDMSNMSLPHFHVSIRFWMALLAIAGCGVGLWMGKTKTGEVQDDTKRTQMVVDGLQSQKDELQELYDNMQFYLDETDRLQEDSDEVLEHFPVYMYLEDKILYVDNLIKNDLNDYNMTSISYGQSTFVTSVSYGGGSANISGDAQTDTSTDTATDADTSDTSTDASADNGTSSDTGTTTNMLDLYKIPVSMTFNEVTYPQVKELLDYGLTSEQRYVIDSMTIGYNEDSGKLTGTFSFNTYFIWGQENKKYEFPEEVTNEISGTNRKDNLFNSMGE